MSILKTIHSPADLKRLSPEQFPALCKEIREQIVGAVSNVGGHLASNLGVVELTVALQYLLDTPNDKIVWDTSRGERDPQLLFEMASTCHVKTILLPYLKALI